MDAIWYGIADFSQFLFKLLTPVGTAVNFLFIIAGAAGAVFWLWYTVHVKKGRRNFIAEPPKNSKAERF